MKHFQPFPLPTNFRRGLLLQSYLFVFASRRTPHACDLREVAIEERDHKRKRQAQIDLRIELCRAVKNEIRIPKRRQYCSDQQPASLIAILAPLGYAYFVFHSAAELDPQVYLRLPFPFVISLF